MIAVGKSAGHWDSDTGAFISADHERFAQILADYNPNFSLVWIPPANRDETDTKPFAIVDRTPGIREYVMRYLSESDMQNPQAILAWIFDGDLSKQSSKQVFARIQSREAADAIWKAAQEAEAAEERADFAEFAFSSRAKSQWKHNGQNYRS